MPRKPKCRLIRPPKRDRRKDAAKEVKDVSESQPVDVDISTHPVENESTTNDTSREQHADHTYFKLPRMEQQEWLADHNYFELPGTDKQDLQADDNYFELPGTQVERDSLDDGSCVHLGLPHVRKSDISLDATPTDNEFMEHIIEIEVSNGEQTSSSAEEPVITPSFIDLDINSIDCETQNGILEDADEVPDGHILCKQTSSSAEEPVITPSFIDLDINSIDCETQNGILEDAAEVPDGHILFKQTSSSADEPVITPSFIDLDINLIDCDTQDGILEDAAEVPDRHTSNEQTLSSADEPVTPSFIVLDMNLIDCDTQEGILEDGAEVPDGHILNEQTSVKEPVVAPNLTDDLLKECVTKLKSLLPAHWSAMIDDGGLHVMKFSTGNIKVVQRSLYLRKDCKLSAHFHGKELPPDHSFCEEVSKINFEVGCAELLANAICRAVSEYRLYEVCCGVPATKFKNLWHRDPECFTDMNPFHEFRYQTMTCRSNTCSYAVPQLHRQCATCRKVQKRFSSRSVFKTATSPSKPKTPSKFKPFSTLITPEKKKRAEMYQKHIRNLQRQNGRLKEQIAKKVAEESVLVDEEFDRDLTSWIQEADQDGKVLDFHKIFLQQQLLASNVKDKRGMRWHPLMIRFALLLKTLSDSAYSAMAKSGFIHLPCEKTLYDYSHAMDVYEGCHPNIIEDVAKVVSASKHPYQQNHVLSFDEVTISQNLVTRKATGEVIGYCNLDLAKSEVLNLEKKLKDTASEVAPTPVEELPMIKKMLSFMVRGVANSVQSVVASFGVNVLAKEDLHEYVWQVVGNLEMVGVRITAFICDGGPSNRGFFEMQPPATVNTESSVVFDTPNIYDPDRNIYFISDPPHLLKTIRNCLYNSGRKKCRELKKNGETMKWSTIVQLYKWKSKQTVKKLFKLTAPCVFLNSWSRMKVALAARVLSQSVHSAEAIKTKKDDLAPYTSPNDHRFEKLMKFLEYLQEWEKEACAAEPSKEKRATMLLSLQTRVGIEITIRGFIGAAKYLLTPVSEGGAGCKFIMAGVFNQDGLEQYFSKQRGLCGSNRNPTADQFLRNQNKLHLLQGLRTKRKGSNTEASEDPTLSTAPLPKRRKTSRPLIYPIREEEEENMQVG
ncbi:uncharacterized protein LOC117647860 [Thrips palmi]|uniref:Uncharacterized protein LOC117647860 n=1 Tax=Thrips palmi TaxID=161013 RepID=A0A6P8ZBY2_THRPL|nr:uncharacterized protein LOC117647860 [Thrips palmi]